MISLMGQRWYEPPPPDRLHFSTLVQQLLSIIAQFGGITASRSWQALCQTGPFQGIDTGLFSDFLRSLGNQDLIAQMGDGTLVLGLAGERLVNHFSFYSAFQTPEEYRLTCNGRPLGSLPIDSPLTEGTYLIFAGRRWKIVAIHEEEKVVDLKPAPGGTPPKFTGTGALVHDEVRKKMVEVYSSLDIPPYLDQTAAELLSQGRTHFSRLNLAASPVLANGRDTILFPWRGDRVLNTMVEVFRAHRMTAAKEGATIRLVNQKLESVQSRISDLASTSPTDPVVLASKVQNKKNEKYHPFLPETLLTMEYASTHFDVAGCWAVLEGRVS